MPLDDSDEVKHHLRCVRSAPGVRKTASALLQLLVASA